MVKVGGLVFQWIQLPKQPEVLASIPNWKVKQIIGEELNVFLADSYYDLISVADMMEIVELNRFSEMEYVSEKRDCDDFSFGLMGLIRKLLPGVCFGIIWVDVLNNDGSLSYKHALNFFIDDCMKLYLVEPQNNKVFSMPKNYKPIFVVI